MAECTYCESDLASYDPVTVSRDGSEVGRFCNYGCLRAHIEDEGLATGACCHWEPEGAT